MKVFLTKIEVENDNIELTYLKFNKELESLKIPLDELTVEYFGNGKGISSLVSDHIRIGQKNKVLIKQYKTNGWSIEKMSSITEDLNGLIKVPKSQKE